jgi:hypothetical protein
LPIYYLNFGRQVRGAPGGTAMIMSGVDPRDAYRQAASAIAGLSTAQGKLDVLESGDITAMRPMEGADVAYFNRKWRSGSDGE